MHNLKIRITAMVTFIIMIISCAPFAFAAQTATDYDALLEDACIVNPSWRTLSGTLSFSFRGQKYTEEYDSARHFRTMSSAYAVASGKSNPVIILAPATYTETTLTVSSDITILGSNAGISPNAEIDLETTNPKLGWSAAKRNTESYIKNGFTVSGNANITIDGVYFSMTKAAVTTTGNTTPNTVTVKNSILKISTSTVYAFNDVSSSTTDNIYRLENIRADGSSNKSFFTLNAGDIIIDGLYFANSSKRLADGTAFASPNHSLIVRNSYFYKNTADYVISMDYTDVPRNAYFGFLNNVWYESSSGQYGTMVFKTKGTHADSYYRFDIKGNTFISDETFNTAEKITFLNGNLSYTPYGLTINVNRNRIIGYDYMFPNYHTFGQAGKNAITADFNHNYFAPTYSGYSDELGTTSTYQMYEHWTEEDYEKYTYHDPINTKNLIYFTDYALTKSTDTFYIKDVNFYDDADLVSIDNVNAKIYIQKSIGYILNPEFTFVNPDITTKFYSDSACTNEITSIAATGSDSTVYAKSTLGDMSRIFTIYVNTGNSAPAFSSSFVDSKGIIQKTAYLLDSAVGSLYSGASYIRSFNGTEYSFTVGTNAFSSVAEILAVSGSNPQIIVPYGEIDGINISAPVRIYGENYETPDVGNTFVNGGYTWGTGMNSNIKNISIGGSAAGGEVFISGIAVTGTLTDNRTSGTLTLKNMRVDSDSVSPLSFVGGTLTVNMTGVGVTATGGALMNGVLPKTVTVTNCFNASGNALTSGAPDKSGSSFTVTGSIFTNVTGGSVTDTNTDTLSITNSEFYSNGMTGALISVTPSKYKSLSISNNLFVNSGTATAPIMNSDYLNSTDNGGNYFKSNRVIGFNGFIATNSSMVLDATNVTGCYFAPYTEDYKTARSGVIPKGFADCDYYYSDYAMTEQVNTVPQYTLSPSFARSETDRKLTLEVGSNVSYVDLTQYIDYGSNNIIVTDVNGLECNIMELPISAMTLLTVRIGSYDNINVGDKWTLTINKERTAGLSVTGIESSEGTVILHGDSMTLSLPSDKDGATLNIETDGGTAVLKLNGRNMTSVKGVAMGERVQYTIAVTNKGETVNYPLAVLRSADNSLALDYDAYPATAYIISPDFANNSGTVSFYYRGKTYVQSYDADRHFTSFADAYAHFEQNTSSIITQTPIFILDSGTYTGFTARYRAVILGANAGINPNTLTDSVNSNWISDSDTVISGTISRTTRVSGNDILTYEKIVQDAEKAEGKSAGFITVADGIRFTGSSSIVHSIDVDTGSRTDSTNNITLTVNGRRNNDTYLQNVRTSGHTSFIFNGQDTTFNYNNVVISSVRIENYRGSAFINKYVDNLTFENNYITGSTVTTGILGSSGSMNPRHDINYVFANNRFVTNKFTRVLRYNSAKLGAGDYTKGVIEFKDNYVYESGNANWGLLSFAGNCENLTINVTGNDFIQTGVYGVACSTAIEGNASFYANPFTLRVNNNRFIGMTTYLPNLNDAPAEQIAAMTFDFNGNFFSSVKSDSMTGTRPDYVGRPNDDPILSDSFTYYTDYEMTNLVQGAFTAKYVETDGITTSALMLEPDVSTLASGSHIGREWNGVWYDFIVGTGIFATMDEIVTFAGTDAAQTVIIPETYVSELVVPKNYSVYGVNYKVNPNVMTDTLGDDWAKNSAWGVNGESEIGDVVIPASATGTDSTVKGITLRGRFYDVDRDASAVKTTLNIENIIVEHTDMLGTPTHGPASKSVYTFNMENTNNLSGSENCDKTTIKNIRIASIKCGTANGTNRFLNEYLASDFTLDGLYCDLETSGCSMFGWWKISTNDNDAQITVKNCNVRNTTNTSIPVLHFEGRNHIANGSGQTAVLNFTNNCFYNMGTYTSALVLSPASYSTVNITDNLFVNTVETTADVITLNDIASNTTVDCSKILNISKNRFVGFPNTINYSDSCAGTVDLSNNYCAHYTVTYRDETEIGTAMSGINTSCEDYYFDYALTSRYSESGIVKGAAGGNATYSYNTNTGVLTLSGAGTLWSGIPSADENAIYREQVTEIIVESGITGIGGNVFGNGKYPNVTKVTLPAGVTSIGDSAFHNCTKLSEINIPEGVKTIGTWAFYACNRLSSITFPSTLTRIGDYAFYGVYIKNFNYNSVRTDWDKVTVSETGNERLAFTVCTDDTAEILPTGDTALIFNESSETLYISGTMYTGDYAADSEIHLVSDEIAASVRHIVLDRTIAGFGAYNFVNLTNLETVTGGENMRYLGIWSFKGLTKLKTVEFIGADLFGVMCYGAFADCTSLTNVTLSNSLVTLGGAAFRNCTSLTSIVVPAKIQGIGDNTFNGCTSLATVEILGAKAIRQQAFAGCTGIRTITLPDGFTTIDEWAFSSPTGVARIGTINIPASLTTVNAYAFYWVNVTTVNYAGSAEDWAKITVADNNRWLTQATINFGA